MPSPDILTAAAQWHTTGATPLPAATDGTKRPGVNAWKQYQTERPDLTTTMQIFANTDTDGIGIICGAASGNLEMLELEGIAIAEGMLEQLTQAMTDHGLTDLWQRVAGGYSEITPSGGIHYYYRVTDGPALGNTKLARRPATTAELEAAPGNRIRVLIETRGEGGWSVAAPSTGRTHPTGLPWRAIVGTPATVPGITSEQRDTLHDICRVLDAMPEPTTAAPAPQTPAPLPAQGRGLRPGDDYNARATWDDILTPHGWTIDHRAGGTTYWIRPGKKRGEGVSATTGHSDDGQDRLFVFTTSTEFESEVPHTKFYAYAQLEHAGDLQAATRALSARGFGDQTPVETRLTLLPSDTAHSGTSERHRHDLTADVTVTDGATALATVTQLQPATTVEATEDALATRFVAEASETLRFCPQRAQWLHWTGARWEWDEAETHRELIRQLARRLPADDKTAAAWRRKMLSANGVSAIARLARTDPRIVIHINQLDAQPWELNTPGGIINLRTGKLMPPDPAKLHTRTTHCAPDFDLQAPAWLQFLDDTFGGDAELIAFVQRLLGVAIVGQVLEQILPFAHGAGANGKSTLIEAVMQVLGRGQDGYSIAAAAEMLMVRRHSEHPAEIAQLAGARMVVCSELEDGQRFAEARIKQLTGRDSINARHMYGNPFTFTPTHTIMLIANHKPMATVGGPAFWRRLVLIPFAHVVPVELRDPELPAKLEAEAPAILAWLARGAAAWNVGGLRIPASVQAATAEYMRDEDTVARFVNEQCHVAAGGGGGLVQVKVAELRRAYEQTCHELGDEPVSARRFGQELRDRWGVESHRTGSARFYRGITLLAFDTQPDEPDDDLGALL